MEIKGRNGGTLRPIKKGDPPIPGSGRPKGARAWKDVLADLMPVDGWYIFKTAEVIDESGVPTGQIVSVRVAMPTQERVVLSMLKQAMKGDAKTIVAIMDRMDGRPAQTVDINAAPEMVKTKITLPGGETIEI